MDVSASTSTSGDLPKVAEKDLPVANGTDSLTTQKIPMLENTVLLQPIMILVNPTAGKVGKVTDELEIIKRRLAIDGDGTGDDKKLTKLTETYLALFNDEELQDLQNRINTKAGYEAYKSLLKQTNGLRSNVAKTYQAIITNAKASIYWESIKLSTVKQMEELKTLVLALRQKEAVIKRKKKECDERDAVVKLLDKNQSKKRDELMKELQKMREEYGELLIIHAELEETVKEKKVSLNHLFDLVKRLDDDEQQVKEDAVTEAEEKVLSDISMDLE